LAFHSDAVIVGGGFFGLYLAEHLRARFDRVVVCEKGNGLMQRASYANQARIHNGYHYPRSILTAFRSRVNFPRFIEEFPGCVDRSFEKVYAVGRKFSKVSARQFRLFMERISAPINRAPREVRDLFNPELIEEAFVVEECAFDAVVLRELMTARLRKARIDVRLGTKVARIEPSGGGLDVTLATRTGQETVRAAMVFNCAYSQINQLTTDSGMAPIPLKHELTEMCLVEVPDALRRRGVTVMCGPFFSCMPFPPEGLHTLSHVRYTPHCHWFDGATGYRDAHALFESAPKQTAFPHMVRDVARYMPSMSRCRYRGSIWEVKTVLPRSEVDDGRPILFKADYGLPNHHVIMGGKIDNVYDAVDEVNELLEAKGHPADEQDRRICFRRRAA